MFLQSYTTLLFCLQLLLEASWLDSSWLLLSANGKHFQPLLCFNAGVSAFTEYAEKYQEILDRQDYFHDIYGENGNEV